MKKPIVKVSDIEIIRALEDCHGSYRLAADKLRIAYSTILHRAKHNPEIKQTVVDAAADMIDIAEDVVYNALLEGNFVAAKFVLERKKREVWGNQPQMIMDNPSPIGDDDNGN